MLTLSLNFWEIRLAPVLAAGIEFLAQPVRTRTYHLRVYVKIGQICSNTSYTHNGVRIL